MVTRTRNHKLPKHDNRGRVRPTVGYSPDGKKAKIEVGNVKADGSAEMERRLTLIRTLFDHQDEKRQSGQWSHWTLKTAKRIGKGEPITEKFLSGMFQDAPLAAAIAQLRAWGIPVVTGEMYDEGLRINQQQIELMVAKVVQEKWKEIQSYRGPVADEAILPADPLILAETASFHEAISAYQQHWRENGNTNEGGKLTNYVYSRIDHMKKWKQKHHEEDFPLRQFNLTRWEKIVSYWKNRPNTEKGTRGSFDWVDDQIKLLFRFVKWLDKSPLFRWKMPDGFLDVDRKIVSLPQDESPEIFQTITKETYTPKQLGTIMEQTDQFWRVVIAVCVNCAFGQSEIGQWPTKRIVLSHAHPHAEKIGWKSGDSDSWICGPRPKTGCYGEHLLWPEVAKALKPFLDDGREFLPVTSKGKPMWMSHAKRPQSQIDNRWSNLITAVRKKHPEVPQLPFGSLRDVLPDKLRQDFSDDVASLALQHGTYPADKLLKCYANFPFRKLFEATRELRGFFKPMLNAL